jgi:glycosyltransferase involved in cell wall biosynthesis
MPLPRSIHEVKMRMNDSHATDLYVVACRLVAEKRIERALDFAKAHGGRVALLGDGPQRVALAKRARELQVPLFMLGERPREEVFEWMLRAKKVLVPLARNEGQPTVILEARALGIEPVVFAD